MKQKKPRMDKPAHRIAFAAIALLIGFGMTFISILGGVLELQLLMYIGIMLLEVSLYVFLTISVYTERYEALQAFAKPVMHDEESEKYNTEDIQKNISSGFQEISVYEARLKLFFFSLFILISIPAYLIDVSEYFFLFPAMYATGEIPRAARNISDKVRWYVDKILLYSGITMFVISAIQIVVLKLAQYEYKTILEQAAVPFIFGLFLILSSTVNKRELKKQMEIVGKAKVLPDLEENTQPLMNED